MVAIPDDIYSSTGLDSSSLAIVRLNSALIGEILHLENLRGGQTAKKLHFNHLKGGIINGLSLREVSPGRLRYMPRANYMERLRNVVRRG